MSRGVKIGPLPLPEGSQGIGGCESIVGMCSGREFQSIEEIRDFKHKTLPTLSPTVPPRPPLPLPRFNTVTAIIPRGQQTSLSRRRSRRNTHKTDQLKSVNLQLSSHVPSPREVRSESSNHMICRRHLFGPLTKELIMPLNPRTRMPGCDWLKRLLHYLG